MKCVVELSKDEEMTLERESINHIHRDIRTTARDTTPDYPLATRYVYLSM